MGELLDGFIVMRRDGTAHCVAVSPGDYKRVMDAGPWYVSPIGQTLYVSRKREAKRQWLHRFVLDQQPNKIQVDHVDGCGLNNTRENLRIVTHAEQMQNRRSHKGSTSKYRGIYWYARDERWRARGRKDGVQYNIGTFTNELAAARAAREWRERNFTHNVEARHPIAD